MNTSRVIGRFMRAVCAIVVTTLCVTPSLAQTIQPWPQRPVRFILPFGPASGADTLGRLFADRLAARWNKPIVIDNRPGGDGMVAINAFTSARDEHTFFLAPTGTFL